MDGFFEELNFPYSSVRKGQDDFIRNVYKSIETGQNLLACAPTGLGKTISALAPAIALAKRKGKTVVFLTSRQTQANQAISTIRDLSQKSGEKIRYVAFISKRNMCAHDERELYPASDFLEFCKKTREKGKCVFYRNARDEQNQDKIKEINEQSSTTFMDVENFVALAGSCKFCPYELAGFKAFKCDVAICDYNYFFSKGMQEAFLGRLGRTLDEIVLVVDEAHNLPDRVRSAYSYNLSSEMLKNALKELSDFVKGQDLDQYVNVIRGAVEEMFFEKKKGDINEYLVTKDDFETRIFGHTGGKEIVDIINKFKDIERLVKEERVVSHVGRLANFLDAWLDCDEEAYMRVVEKDSKKDKQGTSYNLRIRCLDPSVVASFVLNNVHSSILMSGTLAPIKMYRDVLGVRDCLDLMELDSPFDNENQLTLVVDDVSSKYSLRTTEMFRDIANHVKSVLNSGIQQNAIVFFPSYDLMDKIMRFVNVIELDRRVFVEQRNMSKEQKERYIEQFKDSKGFAVKSKVLFAVTSGSFAEGLDLPDKALEMVVVVGLPLAVPDLYTNAVIRHYDKKFRNGQNYGYIYPAMNKIIQAAGRCIRSENDRGVIVLMDFRFSWPLYAMSFPKHWRLRIAKDLRMEVANFFDKGL